MTKPSAVKVVATVTTAGSLALSALLLFCQPRSRRAYDGILLMVSGKSTKTLAFLTFPATQSSHREVIL